MSPTEPRFPRQVVFHVDDLGMCHGANAAFFELAANGAVTCGSVMVPCPWFPQIVEAAARDPALDVGVHLTLTSEWPHYRWAPLSTRSRSSGLIDADGYFWGNVRSLSEHVVIEAAEGELRAQIDRALASGLRPTHIDAHMAAAMLPQLLDVHFRLALEYRLFPVLPRHLSFAPDRIRYDEVIAKLDDLKLPVVDRICGTQAVADDEVEGSYEHAIAGLQQGVTHFALHCTMPGDFQFISPVHAPWRFNEYRLFARGAVSRWCERFGVTPIGTRKLQKKWHSRLDEIGAEKPVGL